MLAENAARVPRLVSPALVSHTQKISPVSHLRPKHRASFNQDAKASVLFVCLGTEFWLCSFF